MSWRGVCVTSPDRTPRFDTPIRMFLFHLCWINCKGGLVYPGTSVLPSNIRFIITSFLPKLCYRRHNICISRYEAGANPLKCVTDHRLSLLLYFKCSRDAHIHYGKFMVSVTKTIWSCLESLPSVVSCIVCSHILLRHMRTIGNPCIGFTSEELDHFLL